MYHCTRTYIFFYFVNFLKITQNESKFYKRFYKKIYRDNFYFIYQFGKNQNFRLNGINFLLY